MLYSANVSSYLDIEGIITFVAHEVILVLFLGDYLYHCAIQTSYDPWNSWGEKKNAIKHVYICDMCTGICSKNYSTNDDNQRLDGGECSNQHRGRGVHIWLSLHVFRPLEDYWLLIDYCYIIDKIGVELYTYI